MGMATKLAAGPTTAARGSKSGTQGAYSQKRSFTPILGCFFAPELSHPSPNLRDAGCPSTKNLYLAVSPGSVSFALRSPPAAPALPPPLVNI